MSDPTRGTRVLLAAIDHHGFPAHTSVDSARLIPFEPGNEVQPC